MFGGSARDQVYLVRKNGTAYPAREHPELAEYNNHEVWIGSIFVPLEAVEAVARSLSR